MPQVTPASPQRRSLLAWLITVLLITSLPYMLGLLNQNETWRFSGFVFGVEDGYSYLGKMRLGAVGESAFTLFYTHEPHQAAPLLFTPYLLAGRLIGLLVPAQALAPALILTYHLMRLVFDALLIIVTHRFIARFLRTSASRLLAVVLATVGGGLGGIAALAGVLLPDLYVPEGFSFLILYGLPHLALARAALLAGFLCLFAALEHPRNVRSILSAGGLWCVVGLCVPFYLAVIYAVLGVWGLALWLRERRFPWTLLRSAAPAAALTLPFFAFFAWVFLTNPAMSAWSSQNILPTPEVWKVLLAYLPLAVPAAFALRWAWQRSARQPHYALLVAWVLVVPVLIYLPINVQRRLSEAVIVPLAMLATVSLRLFLRGKGKILAGAYLAVTVSSAAFLLLGGLLVTLVPASPVFYTAADEDGFRWLAENACPEDVIIAAPETAMMLPTWATVRTYYGHPVETLNAGFKLETVLRLYSGTLPQPERSALLRDSGARWVWYGANEQVLSASPPDDWADSLTLAYNARGVQIYTVTDAVLRC